MKTAISMPDEVYSRVDDYARRHRLNRSEFFVLAARRLLDEEERQLATDAINAALKAAGDLTSDEVFLRRAAQRVAQDSDW